MPNQSARLDTAFQALSDPTRRAVLEALGHGPQSMTKLAEPFAMALPSFSQHLDVLEGAGLVRSRKEGRLRIYTLHRGHLKTAEDWLSKQRTRWEQRLDQLDDYLKTMEEEKR